MKISIITICYNAQDTIEETIENVLSQSYADIEYIVVDGKSTDNTVSLIEKYQDRIAAFICEKDTGVYNAMNKGIALATGDVIFFLNSGDLFYNDHVVEHVVDFIKENDDVEMVYGDVIVVDPDKAIARIQSIEKFDKINFYDGTICHQAIFAKTSLFKKYGGFDESYIISADYEWLLRLIFYHRVKIMRINLIVAFYQLGGLSSAPENYGTYLLERDKIRKIYYNKLELYLFQNERFLRIADISLRRVIAKIAKEFRRVLNR